MRNYISQALKQVRPQLELQHDTLIRERIEYSQAFTHNSVRGSIEGEGIVRNCFILGKVKLAKGAMLLNSIIDTDVNLEIEEDAIVTDCSLHAIRTSDHDIPVDIKVRKHAKVCHVVASQSLDIGEYARLEVVSFNSTDTMYGCKGTDGVHISDGCFLFESCVYLQSNLESPRDTRFTLGDNALMLHTNVTAFDSDVTVGANSTWCNYNLGIGLSLDNQAATYMGSLIEDSRTDSLYDILNRDWKQEVTARFRDVSCTIGEDFYIATTFRIGVAFEKLPNPRVQIGDRVNIINTDPDSTNTSSLICVHNMNIGNDVTIARILSDGYYGDTSLRTVTVGDHSLLVLRRHDDKIPAFDKFVPANKIATI